MARRTLSKQQIQAGMNYIHEKMTDPNMSTRDIAKDPNLPFSLTTYYKYYPKYEKQLKKLKGEENITLEASKAPVSVNEAEKIKPESERKQHTYEDGRIMEIERLMNENEDLKEEINMLNRFIVQQFISRTEGIISDVKKEEEKPRYRYL